MVQGLSVASGRTHLVRPRRELASRARTTHTMRVATRGRVRRGPARPRPFGARG